MTPKVQPVLQYDDVDGAPTVVPLPQQQDLYEAVDDDDARPPPKPAAVPPPKPEAAQPPKPAAPLPQAPPQPRKLYGEEALRCWMARSMSRDDAAEVLRG